MEVLTGSEVDQTPTKSAIKGQLPWTLDESENCTSFPGAVALWSAVAFTGVIPVLITHVLLEVPHVTINPHKNSKGNIRSLSHI
jgi:hypothetical protein